MADTHDSMTRPVIEKVDQLSRLPPELLDDIFDLAYTLDHPPTGPLSKPLLSWYEIGLYRRIKLSKDTSAVKLATKINKEAEKGKLVSTLSLAGVQSADFWAGTIKLGDIGNFVKSLINLKVLDLGVDALQLLELLPICRLGSPGSSTPADLGFAFFSNLTYLRSAAPQGDSDFPFRIFTRIPSLVNLDIIGYSIIYHSRSSDSLQNQPLLPNLTSLSIKGEISTDSCIVTLCSMSPNLLRLRLEASAPAFDQLLPLLPVNLTELDIRISDDGFDYPIDVCDHLLPRFTQLKHLSLGEFLFSPDLPIYAAKLSALEILELDRGDINFEQFSPLLTGPTRLKHLRRLKLNLYKISALPYRFTLDADETDARGDPLHEKRFVTYASDTSDIVYLDAEAQDVKEFIEVAQREGIEVTGSIRRALQVFDARLLDIANFIVYECWRLRDLKPFKDLLADDHDCGRLPSLDLDNLDPTKLKLVKTELPEENWFSWTLENESSESE